MAKPDLNQIADDLFEAFVAHDYDRVSTMLAPDATLRQNDMPPSSFSESRKILEMLPGIMGDHTYEDVQRVVGDNAIVEEHRVRSTTPKGVELNMAACVVIKVDDEGLITKINEYLDPKPVMDLLQ